MKKYNLSILFGLLLGIINTIQAQEFDWQKRYNIPGRSLTAYGVAQAPVVGGTNNGYVMVGISANTSPSSEIKAIALKTLANGEKDLTFGSQGVLSFSFGANAYTCAYGIKTVSDGYIIAGATRLSATDKWNAYVAKLSLTGAKVWEKSLGNPLTNELAFAVDVAASGNIAIAGTADITTGESTQAMLLILNSGGNYIQTPTDFNGNAKLFGEAKNDVFRDVKFIVTTVASVTVTHCAMVGTVGKTSTAGDNTEALLVITDVSGNQTNSSVHFTKSYAFDASRTTNAFAGGIVETGNGGYSIAGYESKISTPNSFQSFIINTNSAGVQQNFYRLPIDNGRKAVNSIAKTSSGAFVLNGSNSNDDNVGVFSNYVTSVSSGGIRDWEIGTNMPVDSIGTSINSAGHAIIMDSQTNHIIAGRTRNFPDDYMYIAKIGRAFTQKIDVDWPNADESYMDIICDLYIERKGTLHYQGTTSSEGHFIVYGLMVNDKVVVKSTKKMDGYAQGSLTFMVNQAAPIKINLSPSYLPSAVTLD